MSAVPMSQLELYLSARLVVGMSRSFLRHPIHRGRAAASDARSKRR